LSSAKISLILWTNNCALLSFPLIRHQKKHSQYKYSEEFAFERFNVFINYNCTTQLGKNWNVVKRIFLSSTLSTFWRRPTLFIWWPAFVHIAVTWPLQLSSPSTCTPKRFTDPNECNMIVSIFAAFSLKPHAQLWNN